MKLLTAGTELDGFLIEDCIHAGGMAHIYQVRYADSSHESSFPMAMKIPKMGTGDGVENILSFEVEHQIMQNLVGDFVPRFVAAGDLSRIPYLVMEYVQAPALQHWLAPPASRSTKGEDGDKDANQTQHDFAKLAKLFSAVATSVHQLHKQNCVHEDLKPANILVRTLEDGSHHAVLIDFGLSFHAHYPDLLAEQLRKAIGSPAWISPEQIVGVRGDARSDIFAIGVMLYEFATGELPFGEPQTDAGMRQRLWMDPRPPRSLNAAIPAWLQEIILKCLEPEAAKRYQSAALLAFDLANPESVKITKRGEQLKGTGFMTHLKRWLKAAGKSYQPSPIPKEQIQEVPIVMVAVPHYEVSDATLYSLRLTTKNALGLRPGARLTCVTIISPNDSSASDEEKSEIRVHSQHLERLRRWSQGIELGDQPASYHVLESSDVADALLKYAKSNEVSVIIMGAATHGLSMQNFIPTIPIKVAMHAPCTVVLVKQELPYSELVAS